MLSHVTGGTACEDRETEKYVEESISMYGPVSGPIGLRNLRALGAKVAATYCAGQP